MSISKEFGVNALLGYKLKKTQHILRLHMDEALSVLRLTTPQYSVLAQLELRPGLSNAALARAAFITPQTMHAIISNLEKAGLIKRDADPYHGKILRAELTEQGSKTICMAHKIIQKVESKMTATIAQRDKETLENLLLECFNNLKG